MYKLINLNHVSIKVYNKKYEQKLFISWAEFLLVQVIQKDYHISDVNFA